MSTFKLKLEFHQRTPIRDIEKVLDSIREIISNESVEKHSWKWENFPMWCDCACSRHISELNKRDKEENTQG